MIKKTLLTCAIAATLTGLFATSAMANPPVKFVAYTMPITVSDAHKLHVRYNNLQDLYAEVAQLKNLAKLSPMDQRNIRGACVISSQNGSDDTTFDTACANAINAIQAGVTAAE